MKIKLAKTELIHFIGIGGIGMSGLALIMKGKGFRVQGSDISINKNIESLRNLNIISVNFRDDVVPLLGFGTSKPDRQLDIFSDEKCYHLIKSHLMLRYEEALIHNTELYQLFERKEEDVLRFNIN